MVGKKDGRSVALRWRAGKAGLEGEQEVVVGQPVRLVALLGEVEGDARAALVAGEVLAQHAGVPRPLLVALRQSQGSLHSRKLCCEAERTEESRFKNRSAFEITLKTGAPQIRKHYFGRSRSESLGNRATS